MRRQLQCGLIHNWAGCLILLGQRQAKKTGVGVRTEVGQGAGELEPEPVSLVDERPNSIRRVLVTTSDHSVDRHHPVKESELSVVDIDAAVALVRARLAVRVVGDDRSADIIQAIEFLGGEFNGCRA